MDQYTCRAIWITLGGWWHLANTLAARGARQTSAPREHDRRVRRQKSLNAYRCSYQQLLNDRWPTCLSRGCRSARSLWLERLNRSYQLVLAGGFKGQWQILGTGIESTNGTGTMPVTRRPGSRLSLRVPNYLPINNVLISRCRNMMLAATTVGSCGMMSVSGGTTSRYASML